MGRDFFDAIYLFGKTKPDMGYLDLKMGIRNVEDLRDRLLDRCRKIDFTSLSSELEPFLYSPEDSRKLLLFKEYVKSLNL